MGGPGTCYGVSPASELIGCGGLRGEVKHLSTRRRRYSVSSGERKRMMAKPLSCGDPAGAAAAGLLGCVCSYLCRGGARVWLGS